MAAQHEYKTHGIRLALSTVLCGAAIISVAYGGVQTPQRPKSESKYPGIIGRKDDGHSPELPSGESYYFEIHGVGHVSVADQFGNTNRPIVANDIDKPWLGDRIAERVPGVTYDVSGENSLEISTSTSVEYTIRFRSPGRPFALEVVRGVGNTTPTLAVRYNDLNLPAGLQMMLKVGPKGIEPLRYDDDGDGKFEGIVTPSADLMGAAAADTTAPRVSFKQAPSGDKVRITITAEDSESGVKQIYYSLDMKRLRLYTVPVEVDPEAITKVYAFADDNAANRSGPYTYSVRKR